MSASGQTIAASFPPLAFHVSKDHHGDPTSARSNVQFQGDALESLCSTCSDKFSGTSGAGETDLVNARVGSDPGAKIVVATQRLHNSGWKEFLS